MACVAILTPANLAVLQSKCLKKFKVLYHCSHYILPATLLQNFLRAPEKGLGLWAGSMVMYLLYLLCATVDEFYRGGHKHIKNEYTDGAHGFHTLNPLDLGGTSYVQEDFILYCVVCGLFVLCTALFVRLVYCSDDPGIVDTRDINFEEVSALRM